MTKGTNADAVWRLTSLADLCVLHNGRAFRSSEWEGTGLPIVRIRNLTNPLHPFSTFFSGLVQDKHKIDNNSALISWAGTPETSFGAHLWDRGPAVLNQHIHKVEFKSSDCDARYFVYAVNWKLRQIARRYKGGVGLKHITKKELNALQIPMPWQHDGRLALSAQQRIAAQLGGCLGDVGEAREILSQIRNDGMNLLSASVSRVLKQLVDVKPTALRDHFDVFSGRATGEGSSDIRVFKTKHVYPHRLRLDRPSYLKVEQEKKLTAKYFLSVGDILMANMAEGTLGRVSLVERCEARWTVDTQVTIIRPKDPNDLRLARWAYYYLWSKDGQRAVLSARKGTRFAENRGQTHISPLEISRVLMPVPSSSRRLQITAWLDTIQSEVEEFDAVLSENSVLIDEAESALLDRTFSSRQSNDS